MNFFASHAQRFYATYAIHTYLCNVLKVTSEFIRGDNLILDTRHKVLMALRWERINRKPRLEKLVWIRERINKSRSVTRVKRQLLLQNCWTVFPNLDRRLCAIEPSIVNKSSINNQCTKGKGKTCWAEKKIREAGLRRDVDRTWCALSLLL